MMEIEKIIEVLRDTSTELSRQPYTTGIEEAFRILAHNLDVASRNLDPMPYIHIKQDARAKIGARRFYKQADLRWAPREGYEQEESRYF